MSKRFAPEVIDAMDSAVSSLKEAAQAPSVSLAGYSGGAAVAVLIAARRDDVASLRTICGNLDCAEVSRYNKVSLLAGSLDPIDAAEKVAMIPRRHFIASADKIIPFSATEKFADKTGDITHKSISIIEGTTHYSGWGEKWRRLLSEPLYKSPGEK
jgi:alpha/beta superfamily hydrolase